MQRFQRMCEVLREEGMRYPIETTWTILPWTRHRMPVFMADARWANNDNERRRPWKPKR